MSFWSSGQTYTATALHACIVELSNEPMAPETATVLNDAFAGIKHIAMSKHPVVESKFQVSLIALSRHLAR